MCQNCYETAGSPQIVNENTTTAAELVKQVYKFSCVGGNLHIVLDDWNLEDSDIEFCSKQIASGGYGDCSQEQLTIERQCCDAFAAMTMKERASALAIADRYFIPA